MLDQIYVMYENAGKWFPTYDLAWKNHYKSMIKRVNYVFTPTGVICKNVGQLHKCAENYFNLNNCSYIDVVNKAIISQKTLF